MFFCAFNVYANNNFDIEIIGSDYIDEEIILSLIQDKDKLNEEELLNLISKKLYSTGNFKNINISLKNNILLIDLIENPKINKIEFYNNERFKNAEIMDFYNQSVKSNTFNKIYIDEFISNLKDLYKSFAYNQILIEYSIIEIENSNMINLDFNFDEGKISKIGRVNFIGNNNFSKSDLNSVIISKTKKNILFFLKNNFKLHVVKQDINRLKTFYNNNAFKDTKVTFKTEYISNKNKFNIIFFIDEGIKYEFDNIDLLFDSINFSSDEVASLTNILENYKTKKLLNKNYKSSHVNNLKDILSDYIYNLGKNFFEIDILEKSENNKVSIIFKIRDVRPKYVNQINIIGNHRTLDKVIRREIIFYEGDPINDIMISESINNIKNLGFFKDVNIKENFINNNQVNLEIIVEEKSSGDFNIGLAFGTLEGATFISSLNQKNIAGTGRAVNIDVNTSDVNKKYAFNIREPRIYKKMNLSYGVDYNELDYSSSSSYTLDKFNFNLGLDFAITSNIKDKISLLYELNNYQITNISDVSSGILESSGSNAIIKISNNISYNTTNSFIRPKDGFKLNFISTFSPITNSNDGYIKNILIYKKYLKFKNNILSVQSQLGNITSLQDDIIIDSDKFALGGYWMRGFDTRGVGPRNSSTSYVGGNNLFVTKFDFTRPLLSNTDNPLDFYVFTDFGSVFGNKSDPTNADESIRASAGYGIKFYSPIGPIGLSWGYVLQGESYDKKREFLFSIGNLN